MGMEEAIGYALSEEEDAPSAPSASEMPSAGAMMGNLTLREQEVANLVARGLTNPQIATELSVSEHTVANHLAKIRRKLGLRSRSQVTAWVVEQRLQP
jgi:DNA-binding NarL/FixJ family response regulator